MDPAGGARAIRELVTTLGIPPNRRELGGVANQSLRRRAFDWIKDRGLVGIADRDSIDLLLRTNLPDSALPELRRNLSHANEQIHVPADIGGTNATERTNSAADKVALQTIINYIDAQRCIVLGYDNEICNPPAGVDGIGWPLWSIPSADVAGVAGWGADFPRRLDFIRDNGGEITLVCPPPPTAERPDNIDPAIASSACDILVAVNEAAHRGDPDVGQMRNFMIARLISANWRQRPIERQTEKINAMLEEDVRHLYAYQLFMQTFHRIHPPAGGTVSLTMPDAITGAKQALATGNEMVTNANSGVITYYEFAYLLNLGADHPHFKLHATPEQVAAFQGETTSESFRQKFATRVLLPQVPAPLEANAHQDLD